MKKIILIYLFVVAASSCFSQNLKFSDAFFIGLETLETNNNVAADTTINIEPGYVWEITSAKAFMIKDSFLPYENETTLWVDDQVIHFFKSPFTGPIWLPAGKHQVRLTTSMKNYKIEFKAYLSGKIYKVED